MNRGLVAPVHPDEKDWIASSGYFEAFYQFKINDPIWAEHRWLLTQPPLSRYLIGIGRSLGGYPFERLGIPQFYYEMPAGVAYPAPDTTNEVLWLSRLPMIFLAASGVLSFFIFIDQGFGHFTARVFVALFLLNSYFINQLSLAMSEAPIFFLVSLSLWPSFAWMRLLPSNLNLKKNFKAWLGLGLVAGFAGSAKLNGIALAAVSLPLEILYLIHSRVISGFQGKIQHLIRAVSIPALTAGVVFVLLNPYLYADPIYRSVRLFRYRAAEMKLQENAFLETKIPDDFRLRTALIAKRIFMNYASLSFQGAWPVNILFFLTGVWVSLRSIWNWCVRQRGSAYSVVLGVIALSMACPPLITKLDWDRYFLFPELFSTIFIAIGLVWTLQIFYMKVFKKRTEPEGSLLRS